MNKEQHKMINERMRTERQNERRKQKDVSM